MKKWLIFFKTTLFLPFLFGTYHFCQSQTGGFTVQSILPHFVKNKDRWDTPPLSPQEKGYISELLRQPFTYLGCGDQSFAFLGEDQKTVIKFFKHTHWLKKRNLEPQFESFKIAYEQLREETGLLYIHLNATEELFPPLQITDKLGIHHLIDLNQMEFALQRRAQLFLPCLNHLVQIHQMEQAKQLISSLIECMSSSSQKKIGNRDNAFKFNYGYLDGRALLIDTGSLYREHLFSEREHREQDLKRKTRRLGSWLKRHSPELLPHYHSELARRT